MNAGLLLARIVFGSLMAAHGSQKLFGWFGGHGLDGTGGFLESIGFRPGRLFATLAAGTELASGVLLAVGLLTPVASALMIAVMVVAIVTVHGRALLATSNGLELPLLYAVIAATVALAGPGAYSLDAALGLTGLWTPTVSLALIGLGVLAGVGNLAVRRPAGPAHANA
jgi:putative oxidoreductase